MGKHHTHRTRLDAGRTRVVTPPAQRHEARAPPAMSGSCISPLMILLGQLCINSVLAYPGSSA
ncbi:MAG TPA: hypothetical protein VII22_20585 [Streptosporangiaceae bacterium]